MAAGSTVLVERDSESKQKAADGQGEEELKITILPPVEGPPEEKPVREATTRPVNEGNELPPPDLGGDIDRVKNAEAPLRRLNIRQDSPPSRLI